MNKHTKEQKDKKKESVDELKKSFIELGVDKFIIKERVKTDLQKSYDILSLNKNEEENEIEKGTPMASHPGLIKKKVTIHMGGKTFEGYRYVKTDTGVAANSPKASKDVQDIRQKHQKRFEEKKKTTKDFDENDEKNYDADNEVDEKGNSEIGNQIIKIVQTKGTVANKVRDFVGLGIYDAQLMLSLCPEITMGAIVHYGKEAGLDMKEFQDNLVNKVASNLGNGNTFDTKNLSVEQKMKSMKDKDFEKDLEEIKERRIEESGMTPEEVMNIKWDTYDMRLKQLIVKRRIPSLLVYGTGGVGKTYGLLKALKEAGKIGWDPELDLQPSEYDYIIIGGNTNAQSMYNLMYENPNKLIIFDDCDSMWKDPDSPMANMLKIGLDGTGDRMITYDNPKKLEDGTKPATKFKFRGQMIFISNLPRSKFPKPIIDSRSCAIDLSMTIDQTLAKLEKIKNDIVFEDVDGNEIEINESQRNDVLKVLRELKKELRPEQVNGRTITNLAKTRIELIEDGKSSYADFKKQAMVDLDLI